MAAWISDFGAFFRMSQGEAESVAGFDEQLTAFGIGRVEPISRVLNEHGKSKAVRPKALESVEANPDDALAAKFASKNDRSFRRIHE